MGWTFTHKNREENVTDFFKKEFDYSRETGSGKVIACAVKGLHTAYIAYEIKTPEETRVIALVCLLSYRRNDHYNFGYKDMDESMGPCESDCPKKILDLLTPLKTAEGFAAEWRKRCAERLANRSAKPKLKTGNVLKFNSPIHFRGGSILDTLKVVSVKPFRLVPVSGYGMFTLTKRYMENNKFEVI